MPGSSESGAVPNSSVTDPPVFLLEPQPAAATASASTTPRIPTKRSFFIANLSSFRCAHPACCRTRRLLARHPIYPSHLYRSPRSRLMKPGPHVAYAPRESDLQKLPGSQSKRDLRLGVEGAVDADAR